MGASVLLAGDSISIGYTPYVTQMLEGQYHVERVMNPNETHINWQTTTYSLEHVDDWLDGRYYNIIHWNQGTWDVTYWRNVPVETYTENLGQLIAILQDHCDILIFATTTPVAENPGSLGTGRTNARIKEYNAAAVALMISYGVAVNDLWVVMDGQQDTYTTDGLHFSAAGSAVLGAAVAAAVRDAVRVAEMPLSFLPLAVVLAVAGVACVR